MHTQNHELHKYVYFYEMNAYNMYRLLHVCVCVCACVRACVCVYVRAYVRACVCQIKHCNAEHLIHCSCCCFEEILLHVVGELY